MIRQEVSVRLWCDIHQEWDGHKTEQCPLAQRERRTRGASNSNDRGNSQDRTRRKIWLMGTYRSDVTWIRYTCQGKTRILEPKTPEQFEEWWETLSGLEDFDVTISEEPTCRCYRCGKLLTFDTMTVDKIFPQVDGGRYNTPNQDKKAKRTNIRPACYDCNTTTGARLASRSRVPKKVRA